MRASRGLRWCCATTRPRCSPAAGCSRCCPTCSARSTRPGPGWPTCSRACGPRTWTRSATTGTPPSSRCSATGASGTTRRPSRSRWCGISWSIWLAWIPTAYVSAFIGDAEHGIARDEESAEIWTRLFSERGISADRIDLDTEERGDEIGNQGARIAFYGSKNWWSRAGGPDAMPMGDPGGPDSEIFYFFPQVTHDTRFGRFAHQNSDGGQFLEIGNSVFMQYRRTAEGFAELPRHNVDFGGGLERIAAASIDSPDVYRIDRLWPIVKALESLSGRTYAEATTAMRVVTDHMRGAALLASDGVLPGNKAQAYVMRRLVRRALRYALELELTGGLAEK